MNEEKIIFPAGSLRLEGRYAWVGAEHGAAVAHPHPLMGGCLDNNVVETLVETLFRKGYTTLRFNFRGVGRSTGRYDEGLGEQDDLLAATGLLRQKGVREILLAGYSFGAWVVANLLRRLPSAGHGVLVSPPIDLMAFDVAGLEGKIRLIVAGDQDPYSSLAGLRQMAGRIQAPVRFLAGADHFYSGREQELSAELAEHLSRPSEEAATDTPFPGGRVP